MPKYTDVISGVANAGNAITQRAFAPVQETGAKVASKLGMPANSVITVFVLLTVIIIVTIIVWILYKIKRSDLQSILLLSSQMDFQKYVTSGYITKPASYIPATYNGQEFTYSYWIYLKDYSNSSFSHYHLFSRNQPNNVPFILNANPVVFMDGRTNAMYISVRTTAANKLSVPSSGMSLGSLLPKRANPTNPGSLTTSTATDIGYLTAAIDYVPLQRWVHITFVVQDNLLSVYMDGDMYTIGNVFDLSTKSAGRVTRPTFSATSGDVVIGPEIGVPAINGYLAKVEFYNYALMAEDITTLYSNGPVSNTSWTSKLGLPMYGFRAPIYRLDEELPDASS